MTDLTTTYLGLQLRSPVVASASPATGSLDTLIALQAAGVGAVVLPSLFEEQIKNESIQIHEMLEAGAGVFAEAASGYVPELDDYNTGPSRYLRHLEAAKSRLEVPVIASLNGDTPGGWVRYAALMEDSGADAIELNVYRIAADVHVNGRQIEDDLVRLVESVTEAVTIPVAVKLAPYYSALGQVAVRLQGAGAAGLVLFNRFYQPDVDIDSLQVIPHLNLSTPDELRLPLRWIAMLRNRVDVSFAATTGIHGWQDVVKALLVGADVAMSAAAILRFGPGVVGEMLEGLTTWMTEHEYDSVGQMTGAMSQFAVSDPSAFERANYLHALTTYASTFVQ
jgi:dihydroorotate dehydrogenase (fumarate)